MRNFLILFFIIFLIGLLPYSAQAHLRGVPIAKINGVSTKVYPVQAVSSQVFDLPADTDLAPENYLVGQTLNMEIDLSLLPIPIELLQKSDLIWDFGDGTKQQLGPQGSKNSHIFNKTGTFVMTISADYSKTGASDVGQQLLQTTVINILPNKDYKLPQPVIKINGQISPSSKSFDEDLNKAVTFDGSSSVSSSKIVAYQWDFDDGQGSDQTVTSHRYKLPQYYATPLLRVKDEQGFFTDEYVTLRNSGKNDRNDPEGENSRNLILIILAFIGLLLVLVLGRRFIFKRLKSK